MKKSVFRTTGVIIGLLVGSLIGLGIINQSKKSQRPNIAIYAISIGAIFGIIGGYRLGLKLDQQEYIEEQLGINKANTEYLKNGKSWIASTIWVDSQNNKHTILTGQNPDKILISTLNNEVIYNHEINSGSKVNVEKFHKAACSQIYKKLEDEFSL
jgi:hypothetical protein